MSDRSVITLTCLTALISRYRYRYVVFCRDGHHSIQWRIEKSEGGKNAKGTVAGAPSPPWKGAGKQWRLQDFDSEGARRACLRNPAEIAEIYT